MKKSSKKQVLVSEDDFYEDATAKEEQAERWALSDIKKTIRFYLMAYNSYQLGLATPDSTITGSYHIYYNQTRLLLKMHSDYIANDGEINVLQYVNMSDLGDVSVLFLPLADIIQRFELTVTKFANICSWDLYFNLLVCYLSRLEEDYEELGGEEILKLFEKFIELAQRLIKLHLQELESWDVREDSSDDYKSMELLSQPDSETRNGFGVKMAASQAPPPEVVEVQDEITPQTILETISLCYRFVAAVLEICIEVKSEKTQAMNQIQANYVADGVAQFKLQLDSIVSETVLPKDEEALRELQLAKKSSEGALIVAQGNIEALQVFLETIGDGQEERLICTDILQMCLSNYNYDDTTRWTLYTEISRLLGLVEAQLTRKRQDIMTGKVKNMENELSPVVFKLCDLMVTHSDNELQRQALKQVQADAGTDPNALKTAGVLGKNALVLLKNAIAIAQKPCGFREYVVDKLKRNYIYKQALARLEAIEHVESGKVPLLHMSEGVALHRQ